MVSLGGAFVSDSSKSSRSSLAASGTTPRQKKMCVIFFWLKRSMSTGSDDEHEHEHEHEGPREMHIGPPVLQITECNGNKRWFRPTRMDENPSVVRFELPPDGYYDLKSAKLLAMETTASGTHERVVIPPSMYQVNLDPLGRNQRNDTE